MTQPPPDAQENLPIEPLNPAVDSASPAAIAVNKILVKALREQASEVLIEPRQQALHVSFRKYGVLQAAFAPLPAKVSAPVTNRIKALANLVGDRRTPQQGRTRRLFEGRIFELWVNTLPLPEGERVTLRLFEQCLPPSLVELVPDEDTYSAIAALLKEPQGLLLISGSVGSGKSTLAAAMLLASQQSGAEVQTVECPIERALPGITQTEVDPLAGDEFADAVRAAAQHRPNIIFAADLPDHATVNAALEAAEHCLVLAIVPGEHPNIALSDLMDLDIDPDRLAQRLVGIVNQGLIRQLCPTCRRVEAEIDLGRYRGLEEVVRGKLVYQANTLEPEAIKTARASQTLCETCEGAGFIGAVSRQEVVRIMPEIRQMIKSQVDPKDIYQTALITQNTPTLLTWSLDLFAQGMTTWDEVKRIALHDVALTVEQSRRLPRPEARSSLTSAAAVDVEDDHDDLKDALQELDHLSLGDDLPNDHLFDDTFSGSSSDPDNAFSEEPAVLTMLSAPEVVQPAPIAEQVATISAELADAQQQLQALAIAQAHLQQIADQRLQQLRQSEQQVQILEAQYQALTQEAQQKHQDLLDQLKRQRAEQNKQLERQKLDIAQSTKKKVVLGLLEVLDSFEQASAQLSEEQLNSPLHRGYQAIYRLMIAQMQKIGITPVQAIGEPFNPNFHEAVMMEESGSYSTDTVVEEFRRGYLMDEVILRPAQVKVAVASEASPSLTASVESTGKTSDAAVTDAPELVESASEEQDETIPQPAQAVADLLEVLSGNASETAADRTDSSLNQASGIELLAQVVDREESASSTPAVMPLEELDEGPKLAAIVDEAANLASPSLEGQALEVKVSDDEPAELGADLAFDLDALLAESAQYSKAPEPQPEAPSSTAQSLQSEFEAREVSRSVNAKTESSPVNAASSNDSANPDDFMSALFSEDELDSNYT